MQYGTDNQRTVSKLFINDSIQKTIHYADSYEKEIKPGNQVRQLHYINGSDGLAAIFVRNNGQDTLYYVHTDHLGSINVITNQSGVVVKNFSFDAWGRRRNPTNWSYSNLPSAFLFSRGYAGHEHLDQFALINMNGRVYDPILARFLSPDPFIQLPASPQNYNRFSYTLNNPLKYTDPDGEWVITVLTMLANMYISTSAANDWQFNPTKWDWGSPKTWVSLAQSGVSGYYLGSSLENYVKDRFRSSTYISDQNRVPEPNKYKNPGNHDSEIPYLENRYAYNYKENILNTFTDGTAPLDYIYDTEYGTYTYVGKSTKYLKTGTKFIGGMEVPLGNDKFDIYIAPYACDYTLKLTYQHEVSHVALDLAKLNNLAFQESAIYFTMWQKTKFSHYLEMYKYYGNTFLPRYKIIVDQIFGK